MTATATVSPAAHSDQSTHDWGSLTWFASAALGNSATMTVGRCVIAPHAANPPHRHPNCAEVLVVLSGRIAHSLGDGRDAELGPGDAISIPAGVLHRARNLGDGEAVLLIAFDSAQRQVEGE